MSGSQSTGDQRGTDAREQIPAASALKQNVAAWATFCFKSWLPVAGRACADGQPHPPPLGLRLRSSLILGVYSSSHSCGLGLAASKREPRAAGNV